MFDPMEGDAAQGRASPFGSSEDGRIDRTSGLPSATPPPGLRRRLVCCFSGCTWRAYRGHPRYGVRYADDTVEPDLRPLCSRHYRLLEERGWSVARNPDGSYTWTNPLGGRSVGWAFVLV